MWIIYQKFSNRVVFGVKYSVAKERVRMLKFKERLLLLITYLSLKLIQKTVFDQFTIK
jgi:hypothetical protein